MKMSQQVKKEMNTRTVSSAKSAKGCAANAYTYKNIKIAHFLCIAWTHYLQWLQAADVNIKEVNILMMPEKHAVRHTSVYCLNFVGNDD